jgi:hypothetical protein
MTIRPANDKGSKAVPSSDQAGKTRKSPAQQQPERVKPRRGGQNGGDGCH